MPKNSSQERVKPSSASRGTRPPARHASPGSVDVPSMQRAVANPAGATPAAMLDLQRTYGNRAVLNLVNERAQRSAQVGAGGGAVDGSLQNEIQSQRSGGEPLASSVGERMGQAFGADFSGVKVHSDAHADRLNRSLSASAFTVGSDIFFTRGSYAPGSHQGQKLLAHELTHVVQQNPGLAQRTYAAAKPNKANGKPGSEPGVKHGPMAGPGQRSFGRARPNKAQTKLVVGAAGDSYEQEADRVASEVMRSMAAPGSGPQARGAGVDEAGSLVPEGSGPQADTAYGVKREQETGAGERVARQVDVRNTMPSATVQRAIGFEFEFGTWQTKHEDSNSRLTKGEEIVGGDGYKIEGEDASTDVSAIEVVTKPYTTKDEAVTSVHKAMTTMQEMSDADPPVKATRYTGGKANIVVTPQPGRGKMQASPAVSLDKMGALYTKGNGAGYAQAVSEFLQSKDVKKKYLNKKAPSEELMGLVMLVVSYLEQGSRTQALNYPKSAFTIMARTSFDKMMELLPEYDFFSTPKNVNKWVELVLATAQRVIPNMREEETGKFEKNWRGKYKTDKFDKMIPEKRKRTMKEVKEGPVMGMPLREMEALPGDEGESPKYKLTTTREEWLRGMTEGEDKLSKGEDKRFEGMGAYGGAMDVEVLKKEAESSTVKALEESGLIEKVKLEKEEDRTEVEVPKTKKAPLFELRGLSDMFGISQDIDLEGWTEKVEEVFDIIDGANGQSFKPGGKPTIAPDVDKPGIWEKL